MNFWWKFGLIAGAVLVVFNAGYFIHGKFEEAAQADALRQQIKATSERLVPPLVQSLLLCLHH